MTRFDTVGLRSVELGESPSRTKSDKRLEAAEALTVGAWANKYFAEGRLGGLNESNRRSVYDRNLAAEVARLKLEEITPARLL